VLVGIGLGLVAIARRMSLAHSAPPPGTELVIARP
jgi:hypothetical protein